jgi:tetratricopeptide (TPR) repeat protein
MTILFWGIATIMLIAAIGFVAFPLRAARLSPGSHVTLAIVALPLAAFGLYFTLGSPGVQSAEAHSSPVSSPKKAGSVGSVGDLLDGLRAKLEKNPDDGSGWMLLARSYDHLGQHADAIDAYERARALGNADVEFEASLLGKSTAGERVETLSGPALRGRIDVSPEAATQIDPGDTVFVFAKESKEQRMPVVALRRPAADLPFDFVLTDKEVLTAGTHLEQFESLVLTARISKSGNATDNSHGLEVWSEPVSPNGGDKIQLVIAVGDNDE